MRYKIDLISIIQRSKLNQSIFKQYKLHLLTLRLLFHHLQVEHKLQMVQLKQTKKSLFFSLTMIESTYLMHRYTMVCILPFEPAVFLPVGNTLSVLVKYTNVIFDLYQNPVGRSARRNLPIRYKISIHAYIKNFLSSKWSPFCFSMMIRCFRKMCSNTNH